MFTFSSRIKGHIHVICCQCFPSPVFGIGFTFRTSGPARRSPGPACGALPHPARSRGPAEVSAPRRRAGAPTSPCPTTLTAPHPPGAGPCPRAPFSGMQGTQSSALPWGGGHRLPRGGRSVAQVTSLAPPPAPAPASGRPPDSQLRLFCPASYMAPSPSWSRSPVQTPSPHPMATPGPSRPRV